MAAERLDKILASQGIGSRKEVGQMIRRGIVSVDGILQKRPEFRVDPQQSEICVDGRLLRVQKYLYLMMNKPAGVLSAARDKHTPTVIDLLPENFRRKDLFPAGRLDKDTTGLLIITNDGDMAHRMLAPKSHVFKLYEAELDHPADETDVQAFAQGIPLKDFTCLPARLELQPGTSLVRVEVREGKFHQVKRMFAARGKNVVALRRLRMGGLFLDPNLKPGEVRELTNKELTLIFSEKDVINCAD